MEELIGIISNPDNRVGFVLIEDSYLQSSWPILRRFDNLYFSGKVMIAFYNFTSRKKVGCGDYEVTIDQGLIVVLEDLTEALMVANTDRSRLFKKLAGPTTTVASVQTDLLDDQTIKHLEYLANSIIRVSPLSIETLNSPKSGQIELMQKRPGGKASSDCFSFEIDVSGVASKFTKINHTSSVGPVVDPKPHGGPISSFNLGMTSEQKATKDSLILPYMRMMSLDDGSTKETQRADEQKILAPDFDEEDLDDDLDI